MHSTVRCKPQQPRDRNLQLLQRSASRPLNAPPACAPPALRSDEVASCSERAYESLSVSDAVGLLMLGSEAEVEAYAREVRAGAWREVARAPDCPHCWFMLQQIPRLKPRSGACACCFSGPNIALPAPTLQHGWEVAGGRITFKPAGSRDGGKDGAAAAPALAVPALDLIGHCMNYAREVERIV